MVKARSRPVRTIGRCIYCRADDVPLTEEHILAANLGGVKTLELATCGVCQEKINEEFEQFCLRQMFRDYRYRHRIGSRRLSKRPKLLPALVRDELIELQRDTVDIYTNPSAWRLEDVTYKEHPTFLMLPVMRPPGLLRNTPPELSDVGIQVGLWFHYHQPPKNDDPNAGIAAELLFHDVPFCRMLAKIAHCEAVARFGLDGFVPILPHFILHGEVNMRWYLVGGLPFLSPPDTRPFAIGLYESVRSDPKLIIAYIRLFAHVGAPTYLVVAGEKF